jgi:hypothetical protein
MNVEKYIYEKATGQILYKYHGLPQHLAINTPEGCSSIDAALVSSPETQKVTIHLNGSIEVIDFVPEPPSPAHIWDLSKKQWVIHPDVELAQLKLKAVEDALATLDVRSIRIAEDLIVDPNDMNALKRFDEMRAEKDRLRQQLRQLRSVT